MWNDGKDTSNRQEKHWKLQKFCLNMRRRNNNQWWNGINNNFFNSRWCYFTKSIKLAYVIPIIDSKYSFSKIIS